MGSEDSVKRQKIALINLPETDDKGRRAIAEKPIRLITIASYFPDAFSIDLIDLNIESPRDRRFTESSFAYVSAKPSQARPFGALVSLLNRLGVPVAAGGELIDSCSRYRTGVAWVILNEGVATVADFAEDLLRGETRGEYLRAGDESLEGVRGPRFDLLEGKRYPVRRRRFLPGFAKELLRGFAMVESSYRTT
jgi:hypothetical protein